MVLLRGNSSRGTNLATAKCHTHSAEVSSWSLNICLHSHCHNFLMLWLFCSFLLCFSCSRTFCYALTLQPFNSYNVLYCLDPVDYRHKCFEPLQPYRCSFVLSLPPSNTYTLTGHIWSIRWQERQIVTFAYIPPLYQCVCWAQAHDGPVIPPLVWRSWTG